MAKFNKMGTKHQAYIERLDKKYKNVNEVHVHVIDQNKVHVYNESQEKIDEFTSKTTCDQFFTVMESLGFFVAKASTYKIATREFDFNNVTTSIFTKSENKKVQSYRDSRKIAFLYLLNMIDEDFIKKNHITKTKGDISLNDIKTECSTWEFEAKKDYARIIDVLERIKHEYKI